MDCIITAGGVPQAEDPLYRYTQGQPKALLPLHGKPMAQWVIDAISEARTVSRIILVGLPADAGITSSKVAVHLADQGSLFRNLLAGIEHQRTLEGHADLALISCADIPLITPAIVEAVIERCQDPTVDLYYHTVSRAVMEQRFPNSARSYVRLRGGEFAGADMHVVASRIADSHRQLWRDLLQGRKHLLRQALRLGPGVLIGVLLGRIGLAEAERIVPQRFGLNLSVISAQHAEIGMDADKPHQVELCRRVLGERLKP